MPNGGYAYYGPITFSGSGSAATPQQQKQVVQCLNNFYNSALGKAVETLSPLQMVPGFGQNPLFSIGETAVGVSSKAAVVTQTAENAGQPAITTIFSNVGSLAGPLERGLGWLARGTLRVAPLVWVGAAQADLTIHAACQAAASPDPVGAINSLMLTTP